MIVYTVGHSTRSAEELLQLLGEADIQLVADVRAFASSQRHPQFNRDAMVSWLRDAGIRYVHLPGLGGRRDPVPGSPNRGWRERAFQGYADHMATQEFQETLAELEGRARELPTAILCAEAVWWRCHRRLISDALVARDWRVEHLGIGDGRAVHELPPFAIVEPEGPVRYPPQQASLLP